MTYLTETEVKNVQTGFQHTVDNGYGKLNTAADVMRCLEVSLLGWEREGRIGDQSGFKRTAEQTAILNHLKLQFKALSGRVA
jgi:hypothetical protein